MTDEIRASNESDFELQFEDAAIEQEPLEVWALNQFITNFPEQLPPDWCGRPIKLESPDFLIKRDDGSILGIELVLFANQSGMGKAGTEQTVRRKVIQSFDEANNCGLNLTIFWGAYASPLPVKSLIDDILAIVNSPPKIPHISDGRLSFSSQEVYAHKAAMKSPWSRRYQLERWKHDVIPTLDCFQKYVGEIRFCRHDFETTPTGAVEAGFILELTPEQLSDSSKIEQKEYKYGNYRQNCDECWLLVHSTHPLHDSPTIPATFDIDTEAFEATTVDTNFDALWAIGQNGRVVRAG